MSRWSEARRADAHRPWPAPAAPWLGHMSWQDVLFLSWPVEPDGLTPHVPGGLELDLHGRKAWITITPLLMRRAGPRLGPWLPRFTELNLRTYVTAGGKPGVLFLSLHAPNPLVVAGGRSLGIPYRLGRTTRRGGRYASRAGPERFAATFERKRGGCDGPLDRFLAERYCLYSAAAGRLLRIEVQHRPWPLQPARAEVSSSGMIGPLGAQGPPRHVAFSEGVDVVVWPPQKVRSDAAGDSSRATFSSCRTA